MSDERNTSESLDNRLAHGARRARSEGRERLASLLEEVLAEVVELRRIAASVEPPTDWDDSELSAHIQDLDKRVGAIECRLADYGI